MSEQSSSGTIQLERFTSQSSLSVSEIRGLSGLPQINCHGPKTYMTTFGNPKGAEPQLLGVVYVYSITNLTNNHTCFYCSNIPQGKYEYQKNIDHLVAVRRICVDGCDNEPGENYGYQIISKAVPEP